MAEINAEEFWNRVEKRILVFGGLTQALDFMMDGVDEHLIQRDLVTARKIMAAFEPQRFSATISLGLLTILSRDRSSLRKSYTDLRALIREFLLPIYGEERTARMLKGL